MDINDLWLLDMSKVIYSFYIDLDENKIVSHYESKKLFQDNYNWLLAKQIQYAKTIGVDYIHYTADESYKKYSEWFEINYPNVSHYNIVNFYKIHLMYELAKKYDEILYLDMDVIPVTKLNFFDEWDLNKGPVIMSGTSDNQQEINFKNTTKYKHHVRSPMAKLWNSKCMLTELNYNIKEPEVFNTGIVGINAKSLKQLGYFDNFENFLDIMTEMINDEFYPDTIRYMFGYDNETLWGVKTYINNIKWQLIGDEWHYFMDKWSYIKKNSKFIHCVSKDFKYVREWCEKNNL